MTAVAALAPVSSAIHSAALPMSAEPLVVNLCVTSIFTHGQLSRIDLAARRVADRRGELKVIFVHSVPADFTFPLPACDAKYCRVGALNSTASICPPSVALNILAGGAAIPRHRSGHLGRCRSGREGGQHRPRTQPNDRQQTEPTPHRRYDECTRASRSTRGISPAREQRMTGTDRPLLSSRCPPR